MKFKIGIWEFISELEYKRARKESLREALELIDKLGADYNQTVFPACPMCLDRVCKFLLDFNGNCDGYCQRYFLRKSEVEGKPYWQVVKEHLQRELQLLEENI